MVSNHDLLHAVMVSNQVFQNYMYYYYTLKQFIVSNHESEA
jgi:hypothetical protein